MSFRETILYIFISFIVILCFKYFYPFFSDNSDSKLSPSLQPTSQSNIEYPIKTSTSTSTSKPAIQSKPTFGNGNIPTSQPSRTQGGLANDMSILGDEAVFEPVQHMPTPIPNDRLMPISGAKDNPIATRLDSMEHMGLYKNILEKDMKQYSSTNKNKFFELNSRESAYHLYGNATINGTQQQDMFHRGNENTNEGAYIEQPKHPNFDLGFQINYKKLDSENYNSER